MARVFISHSGADVRWTDELRRWLVGHQVFLHQDVQDGIVPGDDWQSQLFEQMRQADVAICVLSSSYLESTWCNLEIGAARGMNKDLWPVYPSKEQRELLDGQQHAILQLLEVRQWVEMDDATASVRLQKQLIAVDGRGGQAWGDDHSPYPGLRTFEREERQVFFGRSREINDITEGLRGQADPGVLTVVGASGCGKSSLVRAGVVPRVAEGKEWLALPPIVPGIDPVEGLVEAIALWARRRRIDGFDTRSVREILGRDHPEGLAQIATDLLHEAGCDNGCRVLVVVDQFEELITHLDKETPPVERTQFVELLHRALGERRVQVLATLRTEFLDAVRKDPVLAKLNLQTYSVWPLGPTALREVIEEPAKVAGLKFEDGLVSELLKDAEDGAALPLLAFALRDLAQNADRGDTLTLRRYGEIGGVDGALEHQAKDALSEACSTTGATEFEVIEALLDLVSIDEQGRRAKRRIAIDESADHIDAKLQPFIDRRLLVTDKEGPHNVVSVAHDAFLRNWAPLTKEIDKMATAIRARREVNTAAAKWATDHDQRALLQGGQLAMVVEGLGAKLHFVHGPNPTAKRQYRWLWPKRWTRHRQLQTRVNLDTEEKQFLCASMRHDQYLRWCRKIPIALVVVILAAATAFSSFFYFEADTSRKQAEEHAEDAESSARRELTSRLVNEAADILAQNRGDIAAFYKLIAAGAIAPASDAVSTGLFNAVSLRHTTSKIIDAGLPISDLGFSRDGNRLTSASFDGSVQVWNAASGESTNDEKPPRVDSWETAVLSRNGDRVASIGMDGTVRVRNPYNGEQVVSLPGAVGDATGEFGAAFSPDGSHLAITSEEYAGQGYVLTVQVWDVRKRLQVRDPLRLTTTDGFVDMAFSADLQRLAIAADEEVRVWNLGPGQRLEPIVIDINAYSLTFSPDGSRLAIGEVGKVGGNVRLISSENGDPLGDPLGGHNSDVTAVAFSAADPDRLASADRDGDVWVWNTKSSDQSGERLTGHRGPVWAVAFSPTNPARLASAGDDGTIRVWNIDSAQSITHPPSFPTPVERVVALSANGKRLTSVTENAVQVWPADKGRPSGDPWTLDIEVERENIFLRPDGERLLVKTGRLVRMWDIDERRELNPLELPYEPYAVAMSYRGDRVATDVGKRNPVFAVWNIENGQLRGDPVYNAITTGIAAMGFSRNGQWVSMVHLDEGMEVLDADNGLSRTGRIPTIPGHSAEVLVFSPNNLLLAGADEEGAVHVWDANSGQSLGSPLIGTSEVVGLAFAADSEELIAVQSDGTVQEWDLHPTKSMLCEKLTRNMSREQWKNWISSRDFDRVEFDTLCEDLPPG